MMSVETNTWTFAVKGEGGIMSFAKAQGENPPSACDQCSNLILYTEDSSQTLQHLVEVRSAFASLTIQKLRHKAGLEALREVLWMFLPDTLWAKQVLSIWNLVCGSAMRALMWRYKYGGVWCLLSALKIFGAVILWQKFTWVHVWNSSVTCSIITSWCCTCHEKKGQTYL